MVGRGELTDAASARIGPLLPATGCRGLPMAILLTGGQAGTTRNCCRCSMEFPSPGWGLAGRQRPDRVVADKAYAHPSTQAALRASGIAFTSPERADQIARRKAKGSVGGRSPAFDAEAYAGRNVVERCFARHKQFRALATRYAKRAAYYRAILIIAATVLWLREDPQDMA
jgi:transposase